MSCTSGEVCDVWRLSGKPMMFRVLSSFFLPSIN